MKVKTYSPTSNNSGVLEETNRYIDIKPRRWISDGKTSHPMKFERIVAFENKNVYFLHRFGDDSGTHHSGYYISLTFFENQRFLFMQNSHWIQKEENIRYIINILFLLAGLSIGILNYFK